MGFLFICLLHFHFYLKQETFHGVQYKDLRLTTPRNLKWLVWGREPVSWKAPRITNDLPGLWTLFWMIPSKVWTKPNDQPAAKHPGGAVFRDTSQPTRVPLKAAFHSWVSPVGECELGCWGGNRLLSWPPGPLQAQCLLHIPVATATGDNGFCGVRVYK